MNPTRFVVTGVVAFSPWSLSAQQYSIDWYSIDGGGGTSTGGIYSVVGTVGQPDAGRLTGASFVLDGGFWGFVGAFQMPGAPVLSVEKLPVGVRVFWPSSATGFVLEETTSIAGPGFAWQTVATPYESSGGQNSITIADPGGMKVFRLRKP